MSDHVDIGGTEYVSSKRASESSSYTQDYIGQLARRGLIDAQRIGGLWYVSMDSLTKYKQNAELYVPEPPGADQSKNPDSVVSFDGKNYISAARAAEVTGYHQDYVGQLAREGAVLSRQIGNRWYVQKADILSHKKQKDALLGAVQSQSVGIVRPENNAAYPEKLTEISYNGAGPYLTYSNDTRDLIPTLQNDLENLSELSEEDDDPIIADGTIYDTDEEHKIPIKILDSKTSGRKTFSPAYSISANEQEDERTRKDRGRKHGKTNKSLAILASIATIVVFLSIGFASFKNVSVYTQNTSGKGSMYRTMTASAAESALKIGDLIESLVSRVLVYKRSSD